MNTTNDTLSTVREYDHDEVRCADMEETDHDCKLAGEPRTCCVCIGHECAEALMEITKRQSVRRED